MYSLVVEDEPVSQAILQGILEPFGPCDLASSGVEGVAMLQKALSQDKRYDLVCLDIQMPDMDGLETLKIFRKIEQEKGIQRFGQVKVFMVTSLYNRQSLETAFYQGDCDEYIEKPIDPNDLMERLQKYKLIGRT
ncbi:MAG: response regulator [Magnetococcales bacterium]|nr:response regulator [Magnetococcales bacterium]